MKEFNIGGNLLRIPEVFLRSDVGDGKHDEVLLTSVWPGMRAPYDCVSGDEHTRAHGEFFMTVLVKQLDEEINLQNVYKTIFIFSAISYRRGSNMVHSF